MTDLEKQKYEDLDLQIDNSKTELFGFDKTEEKLEKLTGGDPKKQFDKLVKKIGEGCNYEGDLTIKIDGDEKSTHFNRVSVDDDNKYTKISIKYGVTDVYYFRYNKKTEKFEKKPSDLSRRREVSDEEAKTRIEEIKKIVKKIKRRDLINPFL